MIRPPAVAGAFYPADAIQLREMVGAMIEREAAPTKALLAISPHAGYVYSGPAAGKVFGRVVVPERVVVMGPNHRGVGAPAAIMSRGQWQTPLGNVELDSELGGRLLKLSPLLREDPTAHRMEHSLEVQLPFLQVLQPRLKLTPICLGWLGYPECEALGTALAQAISSMGEDVLMVASTDMTHYEPAAVAREKDELAISCILELDPRGLYDVVRTRGITMCGVIPTVVGLVAARQLGASRAELVVYTNSGEVTGDYYQVVAYAGIVVS